MAIPRQCSRGALPPRSMQPSSVFWLFLAAVFCLYEPGCARSLLASSANVRGSLTSKTEAASVSTAADDAAFRAPPNVPGSVLYAQHGADWQQGACASRLRQSPISLDHRLHDPPDDSFKYHYGQLSGTTAQMVATNGMLVAGLSGLGLGAVEYRGVVYELNQIVIHGPAEHLIRGERQPLEVQLVHRTVDSRNDALVVALPVWCEHPPAAAGSGGASPAPAPLAAFTPPDPAEVDFNAAFQPFVAAAPPSSEGTSAAIDASSAALDVGILLQDPALQASPFFAYAGSMTSPPCEERTTWLVRREPLIASDGQVKALADALFAITGGQGSFRTVMPLYQRDLWVLSAQKSVAPLAGSGGPAPAPAPASAGMGRRSKFLPLGPEPQTDGELHSLRAAQVARDKAVHAAAYADAVITRLREGEEAYQAALRGHATRVPSAPAPAAAAPAPSAVVGGIADTLRTAATNQAAANAAMLSR
eukprot:TRINITY_DN14196_c0_g2_i1.p1 TRINITY_DN14196_c0_g2~~TRINITY_DN14196_c0_g2_i1.p1  ORF type:complete len:476 (+),score=79.00 TRINITY_DN14196_c0_g2_i1:61-1488(+)